MKNKIENLNDFKKEKRRVRLRIKEIEGLIEEDINQLKDSLKPWRLAGNAERNLLISEHDGVVGETIGLTVSGLIRKVLLRRANWLVKFIVVYMLKNYTRNLVLKNSDTILDWVKKQFSKV